jgi:hypothetical protein
MSKIQQGTHPLEVDMLAIDSGLVGYRYELQDGAGSYEGSLVEPKHEVTWTCEDDGEAEEPEVAITVTDFAELMRKARAYDRLVSAGVVDEYGYREGYPGCTCEGC